MKMMYSLRLGLPYVAMLCALTLLFWWLPMWQGVDWQDSFVPAVKNLPRYYDADTAFAGFPLQLLLLPHAALGALGAAFNRALLIFVPIAVIHRLRGGVLAYLLAFSNPFFLSAFNTNQVDWIPLAAWLAPTWLGLILLSVKPQVLGGAALVWLYRHRAKPIVYVPTLAVWAFSLSMWDIGRVVEQIASVGVLGASWDYSPFPFAIPLGLWLLWRGWRDDDEVVAASATPCLMPYFAPYSLYALVVLLACKYPRWSMVLSLGFWWYIVVEIKQV